MPRSVLVVDDHEDTRELLSEYLAHLGFAVATAHDGATALTRAERLQPDVVLMDLWLPGTMDGWEATRRLKAMLKHLVVIAVTAHVWPQDHQKALHAGCQGVFTKPVNLAALAAQIAEVTQRRRDAS
jgi:CheY-like chemotaxis protein